jgi:hypothetical protein
MTMAMDRARSPSSEGIRRMFSLVDSADYIASEAESTPGRQDYVKLSSTSIKALL